MGWDARVVDWSPFQQVYLFPPSSFSRTASSQKREVFSDGSFNCPVPEWPCFGSIGFQSKINAATSRFLFPTLVDRREEGRKKEVLRLLDVGILDIPFPSPPEHAALGSMSLPNTPFASLVSGSSAPAQ